MKKYTFKKLLFFALLVFSSSLKAQTGYTINLVTTGFKDSTMIYLENRETDLNVDSALLYNGKLTFKGHVEDIIPCMLHTAIVNGNVKYVVLYLENKTITINGSYDNFSYSKIEGSEINDYWAKSRDWQKNYQRERDSIMKILFSPEGANSPLRKEMIARYKAIDKTVQQYRLNFIKTEKQTYFSLHELYYLRNGISVDTLQMLFTTFPKILRDSKAGAIILAYIDNKTPEIDKRFVDIEGIDVSGLTHKLSDFLGKYVLLDFWASWCGPCRQGNPALLKTYNLYRPKGFEVVGYSIDAKKDSWVKAIKDDHLNWLNISDLKGSYSIGAASYKVEGIPRNFLIDPNGIIIAKDVWGTDLEKKLKDIYK